MKLWEESFRLAKLWIGRDNNDNNLFRVLENKSNRFLFYNKTIPIILGKKTRIDCYKKETNKKILKKYKLFSKHALLKTYWNNTKYHRIKKMQNRNDNLQ